MNTYYQNTVTNAGSNWCTIVNYCVTGTIGNYAYGMYQTGQTYQTNNITYCSYPPAETEEQRLEREQRERDWQAKEDARRKRAKEALLLVLNKKQQKQFEEEKHFELKVNSRLYRVRPGCRVEELDPRDKKILSYFCIHPELSHDLPPEDVAISQKLWLETDEAAFRRIANETVATPRDHALTEAIAALDAL